MTILTRRFFAHGKGNHDETFYHLARDTESGEVFILHEWYVRTDVGSERIELSDFLTRNASSANTKLLAMIGTLVTE
jgi:hypothetical protein